jgi:hypothetical protein
MLWPAAVILMFGGTTPSQDAAQKVDENKSIANFVDIAEKAGLTAVNVFGGVDTKKYIIETTGTGVAIFDYDNDGWPDIFIVNGTTLEGVPTDQAPTNHLYHNNHDGTFTDKTEKAGLVATGWGQGVCVGDYDNDGWEDLYVTYYGKNRLYHNDHGVFTEVAEKAGVAGSGKAWALVVRSLITTVMGDWTWSLRITWTSIFPRLPFRARAVPAYGRAYR